MKAVVMGMQERAVKILCFAALFCLFAGGQIGAQNLNSWLQKADAERSAAFLMAEADYYAQSGKIAEALIHYQKALTLEPDLTECHYKLGQIFFDQREYTFAEFHFKRVIEAAGNLRYLHYYLDTLLALANTYYRIAESVDPGSDQNISIVLMQRCIDDIISACEKDGKFDTGRSQYLDVNREYYLARAWYLKARLLWDKNRDQEYPKAFENAYRSFGKLKDMQRRAVNYAHVAFKETECLYFLYRHHMRLRERSKAGVHHANAMQVRAKLIEKINALLADPATAYHDDIPVYRAAVEKIDDLFSGKVRIDPLFHFFKIKDE